MSLALQSLVALTLIISAAVASLPLLIGAAAPRQDPGAPSLSGKPLPVVEAPGGRWYLRGEPIGRPSLVALMGSNQPSHTIQYLPSAALSMAEVSGSLRWLRRLNPAGAVLTLPPGAGPEAASPTPRPRRR